MNMKRTLVVVSLLLGIAALADVPSYNIPGVSGELNFTQKALAGIFLGTITKWNDPEIAKANSGVNLPAADIVVVHRADGSGTSYIFTDFLSKASDDWKNKVGKGTSVQWPVGLGGKRRPARAPAPASHCPRAGPGRADPSMRPPRRPIADHQAHRRCLL